jgi:hypothetical protein
MGPVTGNDSAYLGIDGFDCVEARFNLLAEQFQLSRFKWAAVKELDWNLGTPLNHAHRLSRETPFAFTSAASFRHSEARLGHVRFAPESRHCSAQLACPLSAKTRHMQCSKVSALFWFPG